MESTLPPGADAEDFYARLLQLLRDAQVPFLVGGSHAFSLLTGHQRPTKDLDLFVRRHDWERLAGLATGAGWRAELTHPHWLGKVIDAPWFVDAIFNSGNGLCPVDDSWFEHAVSARLLGQAVRLVPAEESIWTKAFVMERERFDGADVAHLLLACAPRLDWQRLLRRFGAHWRVLLAHLVLFGFVYPGQRSLVPGWVMEGLLHRLQAQSQPQPTEMGLCAGTLLSREQYLPDVDRHGYRDARALPHNPMSDADIAEWTAAALAAQAGRAAVAQAMPAASAAATSATRPGP